MKSLILKGERDIRLTETDRPRAGKGSAVVRVDYCGICGTDLHLWKDGASYAGVVPGHEISGVIEEIDEESSDLRPGDRVAVFPAAFCGSCHMCRAGLSHACAGMDSMGIGCDLDQPGGYAQLVKTQADTLFPLPDSVGTRAAALVEPMSVALHAVKLAGIKASGRVLIAGAGIIGLLAAALVRLSGVKEICLFDINEDRIHGAKAMGAADMVFQSGGPEEEKIKEMMADSFDVMIDCTGAGSAVNLGICLLHGGGGIVAAGLQFVNQAIDTYQLSRKELWIKGSFGQTHEDFAACIEILKDGKLDAETYIVETVGMDRVQEALEHMASGAAPGGKLLIKTE